MFTYNHFWGANRAILLYPRGNNSTSPDFKAFHDDKDHHCKMGYVSVLNEINKLDKKIGQKIVEVMEVG